MLLFTANIETGVQVVSEKPLIFGQMKMTLGYFLVRALSATPEMEAQRLPHTRVSLRVGLSCGQLRQLVHVLRDWGKSAAAARAENALQKVQPHAR